MKGLFSLKTVLKGGMFGRAGSGQRKSTGEVSSLWRPWPSDYFYPSWTFRGISAKVPIIASMPFPNNVASAENPAAINFQKLTYVFTNTHDGKISKLQASPVLAPRLPASALRNRPCPQLWGALLAQRLFATIHLCYVHTQLAFLPRSEGWEHCPFQICDPDFKIKLPCLWHL